MVAFYVIEKFIALDVYLLQNVELFIPLETTMRAIITLLFLMLLSEGGRIIGKTIKPYSISTWAVGKVGCPERLAIYQKV